MRGVEPMPLAANGWGRLGRTLLLFLRLYVGCLIATPLVMFSTVILGGLYQGRPNPFDDIGVLLGWSAVLLSERWSLASRSPSLPFYSYGISGFGWWYWWARGWWRTSCCSPCCLRIRWVV